MSLPDLPNIKAITGHPKHDRIRLGDYRIEFVLEDAAIELIRVMRHRECYRYFSGFSNISHFEPATLRHNLKHIYHPVPKKPYPTD